MAKTYSMQDLKQAVLTVMKDRVEAYTKDLVELRKKELSIASLAKGESDSCLLCGSPFFECLCLSKAEVEKCGDLVPVKKSSIFASKMKKADVPMAPAPTKEGSAPHPRSVGGSPKVGLAKSSPIFSKPKAKPALQKSEELGACLFCAKPEHAGKCST